MTTSIVRRLYIYAAALLGLQMLAAGARQLLGLLLNTVLPGQTLSRSSFDAEQLSYSVALLVVGLLLWSIHWSWAQRGLSQPEERHSALRRLYGYTVLLIAALSLLFNLRDLLGLLLRAQPSLLSASWGTALAGAVVNGVVWAYHWRVLGADRAMVEAQGAAATLRRWYLVLTQVVSLSLASYAAIELLRQLLSIALTPALGTTDGLRQTVAQLIAGLLIWLPHELWAQRLQRVATPLQDGEVRSTLRQVYAALVITAAAIGLLGGLATLLYGVLLLVLGGTSWAELRSDQIEAVAVVLVAAPLWWYHRAQLAQQAQLSSVAARIMTARRLIGYLTAAIGLVALFFGLGGLLSTLLRLLLAPDALGGSWQEALSFDLALSIVALPVYSWTILRLERLTAGNAEEQRTLARRIYLYGALLFGIVALIVAGVGLLQQVLGGLLGATRPDRLVEIGRWLGYGLISLAITWYHVVLLRRVGAVRADTGRGQTIVLLADEPLRALLAESIARELPGAQIVAPTLEQRPALADLLREAQVLVAPLSAALHGPQAAAINSFAGRRLLVPDALPGFELVGAQQDSARLARETARALRNQEPRTKNQEPEARNQEPGARSQEPRAEQRAAKGTT